MSRNELEYLARRIKNKDFALFLGSGVNSTLLPTEDELSKELIGEFQLSIPQSQASSLPYVAQRVDQRYGRDELFQYVKRRLTFDQHDNRVQPGQTHELIRDLGFERMVTTNYDDLIVQTYQRNGRPILHFVPKSGMPWPYSDQDQAVLIAWHGTLLYPSLLVLTEEDYTRFLDQFEDRSKEVKEWYTRHPFLFIGYNLGDPNFRMLHMQVDRLQRAAFGTSTSPRKNWAIQRGIDQDDAAYWRSQGIEIIDADIQTFLEDIYNLIHSDSKGQPAPPKNGPPLPSDSIRVELSLVESNGSRPPADTNVYVWLSVSNEDFDVLSNDVQQVGWGNTNPDTVVFDLRSRRDGPHEVRIEIYHESNYLGAKTQSIEVRTGSVQAVQIAATITLVSDLAAPDLVVRFFNAGLRNGEKVYHYRVSSPLPELQIKPLQYMGSVTLNDPARAIRPLLDELDRWANVTEPDEVAAFGDRLKKIGQDLYRQLVPKPLDELYWRLPAQCDTLQIISDEPNIPWEMLCPSSSDSEKVFAQRFALTRWHPDASTPPSILSLNQVKLIRAQPADKLRYAEQEMSDLEEIFGENAARIEPPQEIWNHLERGDFDALHIISHGRAKEENANESYIELAGGRHLKASDLAGARWDTHHPLIFINACYIGREGVGLTGLGGWASMVIGHAHAGAFVGPLWQATDATARVFATTFYAQLQQGATIGNATRTARAAIALKPDPTWLCYTVYAHPNMHIPQQVAQEESDV
jgi:hypothetical protein